MCLEVESEEGKINKTLQIVPSSSKGKDAVNFRQLKESNSLHLEDQIVGVSEVGEIAGEDLFGAFSSVTLHYDGDQ